MKTVRIAYLLLLLLIVGAIGYVLFSDHLPPRTPIKVARLISDLPIPKNSRVVEFDEYWISPNGDGEAFIVIELAPHEASRLAAQAQSQGYRPISQVDVSERVRDAISSGSGALGRSSGTKANGWVVVIDTINNRVIIHTFAS